MDNMKTLEKLCMSGDLADNWKKWKQRWNLYAIASGANEKDEAVQCAIFLHLIGEEPLDIYNTFTFNADEVDKIRPLIQKFDNYFAPKKNITFQRYLFNTCIQNGRPFDNFLVDIKNKAKTCDFGNLEDSLVRDRIVCGIDSKEMRERLLRDSDLTLTKAANMVRAFEISKMQVSDLEGTHTAADSIRKYKRASKQTEQLEQPTKRKCYFCGTFHKRLACPAYGKTCSKCNKPNHFASVCKSFKKVNEVENKESNSESEIDINELYIDHIGSSAITQNNELTINAEINSYEITFKLDTGAQCNIIPITVFNKINKKPKLFTTKTTLKAYGGHNIELIGKCQMTLTLPGKELLCEFFIVNTKYTKPLLGLKTCQDLDIINIHQVNKSQANDPLINEYSEVFKGLGRVEGEYHINVNPNAKPVIHASRKVPLTILPRLKKTLKKLTEANVISKIETPTDWVNSLVIVEKKDKSLRLCLDPKELNQHILRDYKSIPTPEEISSKLHGKSIFSVIDMADCYWHITLDEPSSLLCTFNTPFGRYKFNRLPFGISCASDASQAMIEKHFGDIEGVIAIHDDLIIGAVSVREHDEVLRKVLQRAKERNIKFNLKKMQLRVPEVKYLGNIVSKEGLRPDPEKIKAIFEIPKPENKQDVQRILGMVNYLGQYIPNLSEISFPLRSLLKRDTHWQWTHEHQKALKTIQDILASEPVLSFFDINTPVEIQVDASSHGLGACLMQTNHPISYASRSLTNSEKHYAQIEKELLAIVYACEKFNQYVYGQPVFIKSDHKPLEAIIKKPISSTPPRVQRFLVRLMKYDVRIQFIPGKYLYIADTLSRAHSSSILENSDLHDESVVMIHTVYSNLSATPEKLDEIKKATEEDEILQLVKECIINGWPINKQKVPTKIVKYWQIRNDLHIIEGLVLKNDQIVIPTKLRNYILEKLHSSHLGIEKTIARARKTVYWPGMTNAIKEKILKCIICLKYRNKNQKQPLLPHEVPNLPWQNIGSDLFEYEGKTYLLVIDYYSKFIETCRLGDKHASSVISALKSIFVTHGIPRKFMADNVPYNSTEFKNFARDYNFIFTSSSPRYPQSNGLSEMGVKIVKRILKKCKDPCLGLLEYHNTPITGMSYSPSQLLMNRSTRSIIPVYHATLEPSVPIDARNEIIKQKDRQKYYYDRTSKKLPLIEAGETIRVQDKGRWNKARVECKAGTPESYIITAENGREYRRNRRDLLKTNETEPLQITRYIEPDTTNTQESKETNLSNNTNTIPKPSIDNETIRNETQEPPPLPQRRSNRIRKRPSYLNDYTQ